MQHVPLVLVPVLSEGTSLREDVVQRDQDPQSITDVLKHRLENRNRPTVK